MNLLALVLGKAGKFVLKRIISYTSRKFVALLAPAAVNALVLRWTPGVEPKVQMFTVGCITALAAVYMLVQGGLEKEEGGGGFTEDLIRNLG